MDPLLTLLGCGLVLSLSGNLYLVLNSKRAQPAQDSRELREFMADLMGGNALVKVTRLDPNEVYLRSPRA